MTEEMNPIIEDNAPLPPKPKLTWSDVWTLVITKPSRATFLEVLNDANASPKRGFIWVFVTALFGTLIFLQGIMPELIEQFRIQNPGLEVDDFTMQFSLSCAAPLAGVFAVIGLIIFANIVHFIIQRLPSKPRRAGNVQELNYAYATFYAPLFLISVFFTLIPIVGALGIFLSVYQIVLTVIATRAIYGLEIREAMIAVMAPSVVFLILAVLFVPVY